jgi:hypothetical protein
MLIRHLNLTFTIHFIFFIYYLFTNFALNLPRTQSYPNVTMSQHRTVVSLRLAALAWFLGEDTRSRASEN